jgi:alkanesulfonate monooxygenase SsuD/methylene tetrahydromethanopterin reductase-like flavin-dependent oxidoreductase (luciferase family)
VSVGPPTHAERVLPALYPDTADREDFGYERVARLLRFLRGEPATDFSGVEGFEVYSDRVQPHSPGLAARTWYGGGSLRSARWAGEQGLNLLTSSVVRAGDSAEESTVDDLDPPDFAALQLALIREFRAHHPDGGRARVSQGLVVIPTDTATAEQRAKYADYAARRLPRTLAPQGPGRLVFAPDLVGTSEQLAEQLHAHPAFQEVDEVAFALPFTFEHADYVQILTDLAERLGPELGWKPTQP